ncbi:uncharacterized protein LOC129919054 [Episyrphus balteatus]|uniref:uncharacterized protein LOC129919054 n=1 Tax=Episyrphus balteatus TaxID=286459 RepID=UPI002485E55F|nr:uncharacterized protein LOC129919054 [Episyrphus balteatus]
MIDEFRHKAIGNAEMEISVGSTLKHKTHAQILFVNSVNTFNLLVTRIRSNFDTSGEFQTYYVLLPNVGHEQLTVIGQILQSSLEMLIIDINILIQDVQGTVNVYTYFIFTKTSCRSSKPMIYNRFKNGKLEWKKPTFPPKNKNLFQCPLRAIVINLNPFINIRKNQIDGLDISFLKILSKAMNFKLEFVISTENAYDVFENGTMTGSFKMLNDGEGDISFSANICLKRRRKHLAPTTIYTSAKLRTYLKPPKPYSTLEILFIPFESSMWLAIVTLAIGKWIWKNLLKKQIIKSQKFSGRFQLICWLFGTFILRSLYEGSIFKFFYEKPLRGLPTNLDEMLNEGYKFLTRTSIGNFLEPVLARDKMILSDKSWSDLYQQFANSEDDKLALVTISKFLKNFHEKPKFKYYIRSKSAVLRVNYCGYLPKFSYLTKEFNRQINLLQSNGVLENNFHPKEGKREFVKTSANFLSIDKLLGVFQMIGASYCICVVVFLFEVISKRNKILRIIMNFIQ